MDYVHNYKAERERERDVDDDDSDTILFRERVSSTGFSNSDKNNEHPWKQIKNNITNPNVIYIKRSCQPQTIKKAEDQHN